MSSNPRVAYRVADRRGTAADRLSRDQVLLRTRMKIDERATWSTSLPMYYSDFSSIIINSIDVYAISATNSKTGSPESRRHKFANRLVAGSSVVS